MYRGYFEEYDKCPECGDGQLIYTRVGQCTCHISPPCSACVDMPLICNKCGYEPEEEPYKDIPIASSTDCVLYEREYKPKPLDNTKIDYRTIAHTGFSMIKEGVYPKGTTKEAVERVVKGSFWGRFEYFSGGKFKYIAYTD